MKLDREPFKDVRVRRALTLASSWKEILETNACSEEHGTPNVIIPAAVRERTTTSVARRRHLLFVGRRVDVPRA